jgi:undecaprenyl-diphosphatase
MEAWLQNLFGYLPSGGTYYLLIGAISFLESLALVGIFVPGSVLIVFAGFMATHGKGDFATLVAVSSCGAILGDLLSYWAGARLGETLRQHPLFRKRQALMVRAHIFFIEHGGKSVFIGRFVGFLRPFIPFVAGSAHMRPLPFAVWAVTSGLLWGLAYPGLGYFFGASWKLVQLWTGRFSLAIAVLAALFVCNALFWKYLAPRLARAALRLWQGISAGWMTLLQKPKVRAFSAAHPALWTFVAGRFTLRHGAGLYLTFALAISTLFAALFLSLAWGVFREHLTLLDQSSYALVQELRHPASDTFFLVVTSLGNWPVLLMVGALTLLWLILNNRDVSAVILVAGIAGGEVLVFVLKVLFQRPRPVPFFAALHLDSASFPSGHAFVGLVFYGLIVYMLLGSTGNLRAKLALVTGGSFFAMTIGLSRIYLGVHWLSDVLAGFALAALWLTFLVTACEARRRYGGEFPWQRGWKPIRLSPWLKTTILTLATLATLAGVADYARTQTAIDRSPPQELR